jgi:hypothetical protein
VNRGGVKPEVQRHRDGDRRIIITVPLASTPLPPR